MTLNGVMAVILRYSTQIGSFRANYVTVVKNRLAQSWKKCTPKNLVFSDISFMAIFAVVTENERIIHRHLRGIHPLLDYDVSESQSMISI